MNHGFLCYKRLGLFCLFLTACVLTFSPSQTPIVQATADHQQQAVSSQVFSSNQILREWWTDIEGEQIMDLTGHPNFPETPSDFDFLPTFETPSDWENNYGTRMRGFLAPPVDGLYTFWIAGDDQAELWLSSNLDPAEAVRIANAPSPTNSREWDKFPEQQSMEISLKANQVYYIEALMKEATESDHLAVAWRIPGSDLEIIDGAYLSPLTRPLQNVGLNGLATQSSTRASVITYDASNAIDGNTDGDSTNNSITHTNNDQQAWWEVDLGSAYYLDAVRLWNRTDCCEARLANFYILVSEEPFSSKSLNETLTQPGVRAFFFDGQASRTENFFIRTAGRYVRVQLSEQNFLSLAEAQIWGTAVANEACEGLQQEAENGRYFGAFEAGIDAQASNGFYAHVPEDSPFEFFDGPNDNYMNYCVTVAVAGLYQINTQIYAADGGSNSFYVTINDEPVEGITWSFDPITGIYAEDYVSDTGVDPYQFVIASGDHDLKFYQREDGSRLDWFEFELVNAQPLLANVGDQTNIIGETISLQIVATDAENDTLTFGAAGLPDGLNINPQTGLITGMVTTIDEFDVEVTAEDGSSGTATTTFKWTVTDVPNMPPMIAPIDDQTNVVGEAVQLEIEAVDGDGDPLTYSETGLPAGLMIDEESGVISGVLTTVQTRNVTITVMDDQGGETSTSFQWTVTEPPNTPPELTQPDDQETIVGETVSLQIVATDLDNDPLLFDATGLPTGLDIDPDDGLISGAVTAVETTMVTVTVSDGEGGEDSTSFEWVVTEVPNRAPEIENPGNQTDQQGDFVSLFISASDADDDPLVYGAAGLPTGLTIDSQTGEISGELTAVGTFPVTVSVDDGQESAEAMFVWTVASPDPPVVGDVVIHLPLMTRNVRLDEPNNSCDQAYPIQADATFSFLHEDGEDWYAFTLTSARTVQVRLTNYNAPGQIIVYSGACGSLTFLQNNGNFSATKIINLPNLGAGTYYVRVITDGNYNETTPYNLIVD
ncbi:MAG: putative Ig domain-containing protein [Chloroflexota bacterium]